MNQGISVYHWVIVLIFISVVIPAFRILKRAGFSGWWALVCFVPLLNVIALWIFAFTRWPVAPAAGTNEVG